MKQSLLVSFGILTMLSSSFLPAAHSQTPQTEVKAPTSGSPAKIEIPIEQFAKTSIGPPDTSLWFRNFQAGETAYIDKKNPDEARRYWIASLGELEKSHAMPSKQDPFFLVKVSSLEQGLTACYPKKFPQDEELRQQSLALEKNYVDVMYRVADLNRKILPAGDILIERSADRYKAALKDYQDNLKQKSDKAPESK